MYECGSCHWKYTRPEWEINDDLFYNMYSHIRGCEFGVFKSQSITKIGMKEKIEYYVKRKKKTKPKLDNMRFPKIFEWYPCFQYKNEYIK